MTRATDFGRNASHSVSDWDGVNIIEREGLWTKFGDHVVHRGVNLTVKKGDILSFITWGGGGWGNPIEREANLVAADVKRGLVSADGARRYGVVVDDNGNVDESATEKLRGEIKAKQPAKNPVFDLGPPLKTTLANAEKETRLKAPVPPVFRTDSQAKAAE